jgi:hypothetical protein
LLAELDEFVHVGFPPNLYQCPSYCAW